MVSTRSRQNAAGGSSQLYSGITTNSLGLAPRTRRRNPAPSTAPVAAAPVAAAPRRRRRNAAAPPAPPIDPVAAAPAAAAPTSTTTTAARATRTNRRTVWKTGGIQKGPRERVATPPISPITPLGSPITQPGSPTSQPGSRASSPHSPIIVIDTTACAGCRYLKNKNDILTHQYELYQRKVARRDRRIEFLEDEKVKIYAQGLADQTCRIAANAEIERLGGTPIERVEPPGDILSLNEWVINEVRTATTG